MLGFRKCLAFNQLKVHPLSKFWFSDVNLHPYSKVKGNNEFHAKRFEAALAQYSAGLAVKFDDDAFRAILHANRAAALQAMRLFCDAVMVELYRNPGRPSDCPPTLYD